MQNLLDNPVYNALTSGDSSFGMGTEYVKFFDEQMSPFAGFDVHYKQGFDDLHELLPAGRKVLYATINTIPIPQGWVLRHHIEGIQFILQPKLFEKKISIQPVALTENNAEEMVALARLTKPGPFDKRTIEFGNYFGIFQKGKLAAMTGQRLHPADYAEISAVCTHPDFAGKGFAKSLLHHQVDLILQHGQIPFLHVRKDNAGAIALYEKSGFTMRCSMHFYFLENE